MWDSPNTQEGIGRMVGKVPRENGVAVEEVVVGYGGCGDCGERSVLGVDGVVIEVVVNS